MIERPAARRSPYIDVEVAQRLLKALDFIILSLGALAITLDTVRLTSARDNDALIGFFCLELVLLSMLAMRSLGLYEITSLRNGSSSG